MQLLGQLDIATLMVCIAFACALFSYAFFRLWGSQHLRGSRAFALSFLVATLTGVLIPLVPDASPIPRFFNIVLSDTLALASYALLLTGIEQFFGLRRLIRLGWILTVVAVALIAFFTAVHDSVAARLVVNVTFTFLFRILIAIELFRQRPRRHLRALACLMLFFAIVSGTGIWVTASHSTMRYPEEWLHSHGTESIGVFLQFLFVLGTGQLLFLLLNGELLDRVETEATRDFITGILNRRGIERALIVEMGRSARFGMPLAIGMIDLDGFKQVNDSLGHAEGDRALQSVSRTIQRTLRAYDTAGRFGGDEFLVILPNSTAPEALNVMERIRAEAAQVSAEAITLSIGVTSMIVGEPHSTLISRADQALYLAKQDGRNCTRMSLPSDADLIAADDALDLV
jgi:diguanylate cyclase (GGDEF)-like protein